MPSLTLLTQPGFTDVPDSAFDAGQPASASNLKALNAAAKFAAVRNEQFWGFYKHGETVKLPLSPADGYQYAREELRYSWSIYWTGKANTPLEGTQTAPPGGATSGAGHVLQMNFLVDQTTGLVTCLVSYHKDGGAQTDTNDGILLVIVHAQRLRA